MRALTRSELVWFVIGVLAIGIFLGVALSCVIYLGDAEAEDDLVYKCWIMCQPGTDVAIREKPNKKSCVVGSAESCTQMWTDWQEKDGWIHVVDVNNETGEGWIHEGYIVFEEPQIVNQEMHIAGCRRVACRKWIGGPRSKWAKSGGKVTVYLIADGWAVTNRGYIQSEYLK